MILGDGFDALGNQLRALLGWIGRDSSHPEQDRPIQFHWGGLNLGGGPLGSWWRLGVIVVRAMAAIEARVSKRQSIANRKK